MIEFYAEYSFMQLPIKHYAGFAYDGRFTYLSSDDKQISVCDENNVLIKAIPTTRFYHTFCYDPGADCFWAAEQDSPGTLYRLTREMEEVEKLTLENYQGVIQGLSYVHHNDALLFFNDEQIYLATRAGELQKLATDDKRKGYTLKICAIEQGLLRLSGKQRHNYLSFFCGQQMWSREILSRDTQARGMLVYPDKVAGITCIRIFAIKYGRKPCLFDYKFDSTPHCAPPQPPSAAESPYDSTAAEIESNNVESCCPQQCCPKPPCCPTPCKPINCCTCECRENYAKVLESIALVEASIAHILNAEGEKLQKVIHENVSVCKLLQVNASVQKTIIHATHLEHTLYGKLETLLQIDCKTCPDPSPKPCPKHCKSSKCKGKSSADKRNDDDTDEDDEFDNTIDADEYDETAEVQP